MEFKVIWSDEAIRDLNEICTYIAGYNPAAASKIGHGILDHVRILARFPLIGPNYPRRARGSLREIVFRSYRVFYYVSEDSRTVDILHVRHGARDEPSLP